jgi:uncharacterized protein YlxW (UPF0749 family)
VAARLGWRLAVPVVLVASGVLFVTSAETAHGTDLRTGSRTRLSDLVLEQQQHNAKLTSQVARARATVDSLTARAAVDPTLTRQVDALAPGTGLAALRGPGVRVSLDDAPPLKAGQTRPSWLTPDDLVVHQQDLQAVVNAFWRGGADAVQVMDQRIVSTSAVRCVGNTLILQGRVYSPPFVVTAIGNPARLRAALDSEPGVRIFKEYVDQAGLRYSAKDLGQVTVPAFDGALQLTYARPAP